MALTARHLGLLVAICLALALVAPGSAAATCLSSAPNSWTVADPVDQPAGTTEIVALHIAIDGSCNLSMSLDLSGASDMTLAFYDIDSDGVPGTDRSVQVVLAQPDILLGVPSGGGIGYFPAPGITRVGSTGWSASLDTLTIAKPTDVIVTAYVSSPRTGETDVVPDNFAGYRFALATVSDVDRPTPTALPTVAGTADVGHVLSCADGSWTNATSFVRQWLRDGKAIGRATGTTYTTVPADVGHRIACEVTASGPAGTASATSAALTIVDETAPAFRRLTMAPRSFSAARSGAVVRAAAAASGARVRYTLSEAANVTVSVQRRSTKTARFKTLRGKVKLPAEAGVNSFRFLGRWSREPLRPGRYRLLLVARDRSGNSSSPATISFRIL